jgi:hypothetical protein
MEHYRNEPLEVAAGEELRDDRTGERVVVVSVEGETMRVRYPDGEEKRLQRQNLYISRLDDPGRPSPATRDVLRSAAAYRLRDRIVIHAEAKAGEFGPTMGTAPFLTLPPAAVPEEVGAGILAALDAYRSGVPVPTKPDLDFTNRSVYRAAGGSSNRKLLEASLYCRVSEDRDLFQYLPYHNGGTRGNRKGFQPKLPMEWLLVRKPATAAELGEALARAFELCTTVYDSPL